jgi:hypothetical protein
MHARIPARSQRVGVGAAANQPGRAPDFTRSTKTRGTEMKHTLRLTLAALAAAAALQSTNPPANADYDFSKVADPKIPDPIMFWCMGGGAGNLLLGQPGYCDGQHYPDGSYWHVINAPVVRMRMDCVIDNGSPLPPLAPPGGCGGAVT